MGDFTKLNINGSLPKSDLPMLNLLTLIIIIFSAFLFLAAQHPRDAGRQPDTPEAGYSSRVRWFERKTVRLLKQINKNRVLSGLKNVIYFRILFPLLKK